MITTLVISGGAYNGLIELGVLQRLSEKGTYNINNIERIHGTSVGAFIAVLLALKLDWNDLVDYFINRPWHKLLSVDPIELYTKKGLFDAQFFVNALDNLFKAKGLDVSTISLREFKAYSGINISMYVIKMSSFSLIELSHDSNPDLRLVDAITMTCGMPVIFRPVLYNGEYYLDGGIIANYPLLECLERREKDADVSEILGITFRDITANAGLTEQSTIIEYIYCLFNKISTIRGFNSVKHGTIPNEVIINCVGINATDGYEVLFGSKQREELVAKGYLIADEFTARCVKTE